MICGDLFGSILFDCIVGGDNLVGYIVGGEIVTGGIYICGIVTRVHINADVTMDVITKDAGVIPAHVIIVTLWVIDPIKKRIP